MRTISKIDWKVREDLKKNLILKSIILEMKRKNCLFKKDHQHKLKHLLGISIKKEYEHSKYYLIEYI